MASKKFTKRPQDLGGGAGESPLEVDGTTATSLSSPASRTSKFEGLRGFVKQDAMNPVKLEYTTGGAMPYASVGELYYINNDQDAEIHCRIMAIFRTNNDSWSCYGFCKHPNKADCDKPTFQDDHAEVALQTTAERNCPDHVPRIALQLRDAENDNLEVVTNVYINYRQIYDIKHTVQLAPLGFIDPRSLDELLDKGQILFNKTYRDRDKMAPLPTPPPIQVSAATQKKTKERKGSVSNEIPLGFWVKKPK